MTNSEFYAIAKRLLPNLPGFVSDKRQLLLLAPFTHVLRALLFERSSWYKDGFYFHWFFMVLPKPRDHLTLSYGARLTYSNNKELWEREQPNLIDEMVSSIQQVALPAFRQLDEGHLTVEAIRRFPTFASGLHEPEDAAYLSIANQYYAEAKALLSILNNVRAEHRTGWQRDLLNRAHEVWNILDSEPHEARRLVLDWELQTVRALKIEEFWQPAILSES